MGIGGHSTGGLRLILVAFFAVAALAVAACGGGDEETTASDDGGAAGDVASITPTLKDAGYTVKKVPNSGDPAPESAIGVTGNEIPDGGFVYLEQFASEDDSAAEGDFLAGMGFAYTTQGVLVYFASPPAEQADIDAVVSAAGS